MVLHLRKSKNAVSFGSTGVEIQVVLHPAEAFFTRYLRSTGVEIQVVLHLKTSSPISAIRSTGVEIQVVLHLIRNYFGGDD